MAIDAETMPAIKEKIPNIIDQFTDAKSNS